MQIYDPASITATSGGHTTRSPFPGNIIPASRLNPTARKIASFWDLPNTAGAADDSNDWFSTGPEWDHYYNHIFRVDHNFSERNRPFVRGDATDRHQQFGVQFGEADGDNLIQWNRGAAIGDVYTFSPQFLVNTRYSYTRLLYFQHPLQLGMDLGALGFSQQFVALAEAQGAARLPAACHQRQRLRIALHHRQSERTTLVRKKHSFLLAGVPPAPLLMGTTPASS